MASETIVGTREALEPASYVPHALHSPERLFPETNCYTDLWIELLHARGFEPLAMLSFSLSVDFEGDQWTFFKPPPEDLARLYGFEVQEFVVYRTIPEHIEEQLAQGREVIVEVDAYYLPDTVGRSYREQHEKSSIAIEAIDVERNHLRYFHGPGLFDLCGDDYVNVLRVGRSFSPDVLPPYIELARTDRLDGCPADELRSTAWEILGIQVDRLPRSNPVSRFAARLDRDLPLLLHDADAFHQYAFVTVRQCGAAWAAGASFLDWLSERDDDAVVDVAGRFAGLAENAKRLLFKLARAASSGRVIDDSQALEEMARQWDDSVQALTQLF
jgi:Domain of unknown function (DUF1839)